MKLTRRDTSKFLVASALASALPVPATAFLHSQKDWPARLQDDLNVHLVPGCTGKLTLTKFDIKTGQRVRMASVIRLDWPPGHRIRRFDAIGDEAEATYNALLNQALFSFAKAWPGCVV